MLKKINHVLLIAFAFTLPFSIGDIQLNNFLIVLFSITSIARIVTSREPLRLNKMMLLFVLAYLIVFVGMLKTDNWRQAFFDLEKKLSLIIFPIILFFSPRLELPKVRSIFLAFAGSCLLTALFCLSIATYRLVAWQDSSYLTYHQLSEIVGMHAAYLAMYYCFAIAILVYLRSEKCFALLSNPILFYFVLLVLVASTILLATRIHIIFLLLLAVGYVIVELKKKYSLAKSIGGAAAIGVIFTGIALLFPLTRERFKQAINYQNEFGLDRQWGEQQIRYLIWDCAVTLIKQHALTGVGSGDTQDELQNCYVEKDYKSLTYFKDTQFNAHNQFLETFIGLGVFGFIVFVGGLVTPLYCAIKQREMLYVVFLVLIILSCLTESIMERRNGVVFFAFFNSFLFLGSLKSNQSQDPANPVASHNQQGV